VEDILRYFDSDSDKINFHDLKKLFKDKDSKGIGKLGYGDFSKWVGNAIHQSEGFYFRHDSKRNPQFQVNLKRERARTIEQDKVKKVLADNDISKQVLEKIKT